MGREPVWVAASFSSIPVGTLLVIDCSQGCYLVPPTAVVVEGLTSRASTLAGPAHQSMSWPTLCPAVVQRYLYSVHLWRRGVLPGTLAIDPYRWPRNDRGSSNWATLPHLPDPRQKNCTQGLLIYYCYY